MANNDLTISQLPLAENLADSDVLPLVRDGENLAVSVSTLREEMGGDNNLQEQIDELGKTIQEVSGIADKNSSDITAIKKTDTQQSTKIQNLESTCLALDESITSDRLAVYGKSDYIHDSDDIMVSNTSENSANITARTAIHISTAATTPFAVNTDNNSIFSVGDLLVVPDAYISDVEGNSFSIVMRVTSVIDNDRGIECVVTNLTEDSIVIGILTAGLKVKRYGSVALNLSEKAKMRLFCDMFNAAVGDYGYARITDGVFDCKLNELTLTYEEAIDTMSEPRIRGDYTTSNSNQFLYSHATFRTHLPKTAPERISRCQYTFIEAQKLEVVNARIIPLDLCFTGCNNLKKINIYQLIGSASSEAQRAYDNCNALSDIYVEMMGKYDVNLKWSPLITKESFQRIIAATPSNVTNDGGYTITVHPDVFAKLTDESNTEWHAVYTAAAEKNISFITP